jgi:hypothetical protein
MKKIVFAIAFAMISILGSAQETVYFDGVTNFRIGYAGVLNSSDNNLTGGIDFGLNLIEFGVRPYQSGAVSLGADFMVESFGVADGYYFNTAAHKTAIIPAIGMKEVSRSRATVCAFGLPLNFTQTFAGKLAVTVGATARINLNADTYVDYINATDDRCSYSVYGIPTNRLTYDIHLAVTYEDFGIYASYSPMKVFANGAGPDFNFFSVGAFFRNWED